MHNLDVRYHADGSIDFDFYRRRAARQRRIARHAFLRRSIRLICAMPGVIRAALGQGFGAWRGPRAHTPAVRLS